MRWGGPGNRMKTMGDDYSDWTGEAETSGEVIDPSDIDLGSIPPVEDTPEPGWDPTQDPVLTSPKSNPDGKVNGVDIIDSLQNKVGGSVVDSLLKVGEDYLKQIENRGASEVYKAVGYKVTGQTVVRKTDKMLGTVMKDANNKAYVLFADSTVPETYNQANYDSVPVSNAGVAAALKPAASSSSNSMLILGAVLIAALVLSKR